jgi:hypothetical protein
MEQVEKTLQEAEVELAELEQVRKARREAEPGLVEAE